MKQTVNIEILRQEREPINIELDAADKALKAFPKGEMGLTPDSVKQSPEFKQAKQRYAIAHAQLRAWNTKNKKHLRELAKH